MPLPRGDPRCWCKELSRLMDLRQIDSRPFARPRQNTSRSWSVRRTKNGSYTISLPIRASWRTRRTILILTRLTHCFRRNSKRRSVPCAHAREQPAGCHERLHPFTMGGRPFRGKAILPMKLRNLISAITLIAAALTLPVEAATVKLQIMAGQSNLLGSTAVPYSAQYADQLVKL